LAERGFQTELWTDPFIQGLTPEAKLLFIYLWTNKHCNQAGIYEISLKTMAFDTGLTLESLPKFLKELEPKVTWYADRNLVWVKNFLKRQCKSQSFLIAAAKCLKILNSSGLVKEYFNYNHSFNLEPLCQDNGGTVLPPSLHGGNTIPNPVPDPVPNPVPVPSPGAKGKKEKGVVKGQEKTPKRSEPVIAEILTEMKAWLGYPIKTDKDPIPNYAKEGQFLKKMLGRHFTREEILSCWKAKVQQRRGEFVSLAWVNEDIAGYVHSREKEGESQPDLASAGQKIEGIAAMKAAGWNTGGDEV
jgi:hypothetical protein